ncbi:MAG TPA: hypothetical protein VM198_01315 [Longimicrobiales bacterium]|nr:hypothetical protein [Longimicrobiales bacterium]
MLDLTGEGPVMLDDQPLEVTLRGDSLLPASGVTDGFNYRFRRVNDR